MSLPQQCVFLGSFNHKRLRNEGISPISFPLLCEALLGSLVVLSRSQCYEVHVSHCLRCTMEKPAARLAVVEGSCSASCKALSKCCRIDSGKSSRLLATFGHDAGVSLDDLLESRDGSDSGSPVLGRTALDDGPAAEDAGLRRAVPLDAAGLGVSPRSPASSLMSSPSSPPSGTPPKISGLICQMSLPFILKVANSPSFVAAKQVF